MLQEERFNQILEQLRQNQVVKVADLTQLLNVSSDTIRRDLELLDERGLLRRVHGGAVLDVDTQTKTDYSQRIVANQDKKTELARKLVEHLRENEFVALNSGTTNIEVMKEIARRFEKMTILTNSLQALDAFAHKNKFRIIIPGGILDTEEFSLYGRECETAISQYNINTAIITTNAVSTENGLTDFRYFEIGVMKEMIKSAQRVIISADSTKLERVASIRVCSINDIDVLCTDSAASQKVLDDFKKLGIRII